jgi:hypothetical protein
MPISRRFPLALGCAAGLICAQALAPVAHADAVLGATPAASAVAAYGGEIAWWAPGAGGYRLIVDANGVTSSPAVVMASPQPQNVTAGPDAQGNTVFLYTRCATQTSSCSVYRYSPGTGRQQRVSHVPAGTTWAAQWRTSLVFTKAVSVRALGATTRCDLPYSGSTRSSRLRLLDRGRCGEVTGLTLRGSLIAETVASSATHTGDARYTSQLRLLSTGGGPVKVPLTVNSGEESNDFAGPALAPGYAYAVQFGLHPVDAFVRVKLGTLAHTSIPADTNLGGSLAVDGATWTYLTAPALEDVCGSSAPCRVVTTTNPFSATPRELAPELTLEQSSTEPRATQPFVVGGRLSLRVVVRGVVTATEGVGGVRIDLGVAAFDANTSTQPAQPTGLSTTTAADGSWSIAIPPPIPPEPFYSAVAETTPVATAAPDTTDGSAVAYVSLAVAPTALAAGGGSVMVSGTVDPAQPGRSVLIQVSNSATHQTVDTAAPLSADGRSYSVAVPVGLTSSLVAVLPFVKLDAPGAATSYSGRSTPVAVTVGVDAARIP